jgi:tetratricopeptide (TPR) repeat protein
VKLPMLMIAMCATRIANADAAQAEALFKQGKDLMAQNRHAEACAAFDASQRLDPTLATLMNQANCREANGQLATAWSLFLEAERQTRGKDPAANATVVARAAKLEARVSKLVIVVAAKSRIAGLEVQRDGKPVEPDLWSRALPIDGGTYTISARAPNRETWSVAVTIANEADTKTVEVPVLVDPAARVAPPPAPAPVVPVPPPAKRSPIVWVLAGAAGATLLGAFAFELSGRSIYQEAEEEANDARQESLWRSANTRRYVAEGLAVTGLACAGVAVWMYLRTPAPSSGTALRPLWSPSIAGLELARSW